MMKARSLPSVSGNLQRTIAEHERACLVLIGKQQDGFAPDNHIVATLCDSVRLAREYVEHLKGCQRNRTCELEEISTELGRNADR